MSDNRFRQILKGSAVAVLMLMPVPATSVMNGQTTPELPVATPATDLSAGAVAVETHQYDTAVQRLTRAIDSNMLNNEALALAYHHRGIARQKLGYGGLAISDYSKALEIDALPRNVQSRAYYNRALAKAQSGDTVGAELDYSHAIEFAPKYAAAYHNRANLERARQDYPTAIRDYSIAISQIGGPDRKLPLMGRALAHEKTGNIAAAASDLDAVLAIDPTYAAAARMRRDLAALPAANIYASAASDDNLETGSIVTTSSVAPRHGEVISRSNQNGWQTKTVRYAAATQSNAELETGSLRDIDMVPAPNQKMASIEPAVRNEPVVTKTAPAPAVRSASNAPATIAGPAASGRYKVQLGAFRAPELASQAWRQISSQNPPLVGSLAHTIEQADLGERGIYYRLQAGSFETADAAKASCASFAANKIDCIVVAR
tara:strand:- start:13437 stop:14732 length:1296 start_codon:yes stop_codon:yes gene_type:complete